MEALARAASGIDLDRELRQSRPLRHCHGLEIHSLHGDAFPTVMHEIGRLREMVFRVVGAGRGDRVDLDVLDSGPRAYRQLIAWDPEHQELVAMYRYQRGNQVQGDADLRTAGLFDYTEAFRERVLPCGIELGRSVVNPQAARRRLGFHAIWHGLGALLGQYPETRFFFGNVSLYESLPREARSLIVAFLERHYAPPEDLLCARAGLRYRPDSPAAVPDRLPETPRERIRALRDLLAPTDTPVPPILQSYLSLGTRIWFGETAHDEDFGNALEIGIIVPVAEIDPAIQDRFIRG